MQDFNNLKVWRRAYQLALSVYRSTNFFPDYEKFGLANQMRRASTSIAINIAEGSAQGTDPGFARFLEIAMGSASELQCQIMLATDLNYLEQEHQDSLRHDVQEVRRMLNALIRRLRGRAPRPASS